MSAILSQLALFASKALITVIAIVVIMVVFFALLTKGKSKKSRLVVRNLNKKYADNVELIYSETLPKKKFKQYLKEQKSKAKKRALETAHKIYVLNFNGDVKASAVEHLREEITAILAVATPQDEIVVRLESAGGLVHSYGLAAAQLMRIRAHNIPLTVTIDKVAASGGYMMACIANKILSAPYAIIGSIGVIVQLPNFNRLLKDKHIQVEQLTAGEYKRTLTMFGENTEAGREKLQNELNDVHQLFKNLIQENRPGIDIQQVATGEHWLAIQAASLKLVDEIKTSDEYLLERSKDAELFEICYEVKKPLLSKFAAGVKAVKEKLLFF